MVSTMQQRGAAKVLRHESISHHVVRLASHLPRARARVPRGQLGSHELRRRRGSPHYKRTSSLAEVAELLDDSKRVAADHYVYALTDYREVDYSIELAHSNS